MSHISSSSIQIGPYVLQNHSDYSKLFVHPIACVPLLRWSWCIQTHKRMNLPKFHQIPLVLRPSNGTVSLDWNCIKLLPIKPLKLGSWIKRLRRLDGFETLCTSMNNLIYDGSAVYPLHDILNCSISYKRGVIAFYVLKWVTP